MYLIQLIFSGIYFKVILVKFSKYRDVISKTLVVEIFFVVGNYNV